MRRRLFPLGLLLLSIVGCAHSTVVDGVLVSDDYRFSVALPGAPYERIAPKDALVALTDPKTGISAAVAVTPDPYPDAADRVKALNYIARDLFFFLTKKEYRVFEQTELAGAGAVHVVVAGVDEGRDLVFSAYVARHNGAIYDIVVWCDPRYLDEAAAVLKKMADTVIFLPEAGR